MVSRLVFQITSTRWQQISVAAVHLVCLAGLTSCCPVAGGFCSGQSRDRPLRSYSSHTSFHSVQRKPMQGANSKGSLPDRANIERYAAGFNCHGSLSFQGWFCCPPSSDPILIFTEFSMALGSNMANRASLNSSGQ